MATRRRTAKKATTPSVETRKIFVQNYGGDVNIFTYEPDRSDLENGNAETNVCSSGFQQAFGQIKECDEYDYCEIEYQVVAKRYYSFGGKVLVREDK